MAKLYQISPTRDWIIRFSNWRRPDRPATAAVTTTAPINGPRSPGVVRTITSGSGKRIRKTITKAQVQANAITKYDTNGRRLTREIMAASLGWRADWPVPGPVWAPRRRLASRGVETLPLRIG